MRRRERNPLWCGLVKTEKIIMIVTAVATTAIMFVETVLRAFYIDFSGFEEYLLIIVFWLYMIGAAYGSYTKSEIKANFVQDFMKECMLKDIILLTRDIAGLILGLIFTWWALKLTLWGIQAGPTTSLWRLPMWWGYASILTGLVLVSFYNAVYLYDNIVFFVAKYTARKDTKTKNVQEAAEER